MAARFVLLLAPDAQRDWASLDGSLFRPVSAAILKLGVSPDMRHRLTGPLSDCYSIEIAHRYRLVFEVDLEKSIVTVLAIGRRENLEVYRVATERVANSPENRTAEPN